MDKLRVLQVNKLYHPYIGGIETVVQHIAEGLKDEVDMTVLCCAPKGKGSEEVINGVRVVRASSLGIFASMPVSLSFIWRLRRMSKDTDVLHLHMPFPLGDLAILLSGYKGHVIASWHSDVVRQKGLLKLYSPILRRFLKRVDRIIVATENHVKYSSFLPEDSHKCAIIPYGIDPGDYDASPYVHDGPLKALYSGRLIYYKGVDVLLDALAFTDGIDLDIAGDGPLEDELKLQAHRLGIAHRVRFMGRLSREELNRAFHECDFFVLPSIAKSEAFGIVQLEAMASGKPVINTNLPSGVPLVSVDGETGLTVGPRDAKALAKAMERLAGDGELRRKYGGNAKSVVEQKYSIKTITKRMLEYYMMRT